MLPQCSHITRKRGVYYYRRRLPRPLNGEIALSLRTRHFRTAEHLGYILDQAYLRVPAERMSEPDLQRILRDYLKDILELDLQQHRAAPPGKPVYGANVARDGDPVESDLELIENLEDDFKEALAHRNIKVVSHQVDELMAKHDLGERHRFDLGLGVLRAIIEQLGVSRERVINGIAEPIVLPSATNGQLSGQGEPTLAPAPTVAAAILTGPRFSEVLPSFLESMTKDAGWRGQTLAQNKTTYEMFMAHCEDRPVQTYVRKDLTSFYDLLRQLPALYSKKAEWKGLSPDQIVEQTRGLDVERITMKTVSRHFSALGRFFSYLKRRGEYEGENPAHGFEFPGKGRARNKRQMWEGEKLVKLFSSPVWAGCLSSRFRAKPGDQIIKDERYWLPILGLYHGNRLEEFAQLHFEDVRNEEGIWFFDINDEGIRQLKNSQSTRRVPIHPKLIQLGFLDYVRATAKKQGDRIFPLLQPGGPDNKLGFYFTKWWSAYRQSVGVYERGLDYHSFRHGVTTKLFAAGVSEAYVDELTGHEGEGTSRRVYLKGLPLGVLHDAISKVEWPEVEIR